MCMAEARISINIIVCCFRYMSYVGTLEDACSPGPSLRVVWIGQE